MTRVAGLSGDGSFWKRTMQQRPKLENQPVAFLKLSPALSQFTVFHQAFR